MGDTEYNILGRHKLSLKFKWQRLVNRSSMGYIVPSERTDSNSLENFEK